MRPELTEVAHRIRAGEDRIADRAAEQIYAELATYVGVPRDELLTSVRTNARRAVDVLRSQRIPAVAENAEHRATTRARIDENVPIEDIIRAYRISLSATHESFISEAAKVGLDPQVTLEGSTLLWRLGDWFTAGAAAEYRYHAGTEAMTRSFEISSLVRALTSDPIVSDGTQQRAKKYGMNFDENYAVAIASGSGDGAEALIHDIKASGSTAHSPALVAQIDLRVVAIIARTPRVTSADVPIAMGPFVPLSKIAESAQICERVWKLARLEKSEVHSLESFTWKLAIADSIDINSYLVGKYIRPLQPETPAGKDILSTVRSWLSSSASVRRTADDLNIHENTVRYRLQKYREQTNSSEYGLDQLFELKWALAAYDSEFYLDGDQH